MKTLLLRLSAPIQSWGDESKYNYRRTQSEPGKSGVIGLISAAMGFRRDSPEVNDLAASLRIGVRVDQPGRMMVDYHTALAPKYKADGDITYRQDGMPVMEAAPDLTHRYYLCDACFVVGLESNDDTLLEQIETALKQPAFPLYLGRRSCPPTLPITLGIRKHELEVALRQEPWQASEWFQKKTVSYRLRIIQETRSGETAWHMLHDQPISFSPVHRRYAYRGVMKEQTVPVSQTQHDPMLEL